MSAGVVAAPTRPIGAGTRRIPLRPAEGWLTLLSIPIMAMVFGGSLQDAGWTPDSARGDANFLPWIALVGVAFGVFGAKIGWGRWRTHVVGALFAGLLLPLIVGGIILGPNANVGWDPYSLDLRLLATLDVMRHVWADLVVDGRPYTTQMAHYHLVFGALVWGAGQLAGFGVFGHRRPLDAVVVIGLAILANMALTTHDQLTLLVLFSAASLLLLIRTHVFEEELTWTRRKIGDPATVGQLYLRGGAAFVTAAVFGSILLTATASSAPLQGVWADLPQHLQDLSQWVQRFAPPGGDPRNLGIVGFGQSATTLGLWQPLNAVAFRAQFGPGDDRQFKWRAGTYAEYTGFGWNWGQPQASTDVAARDILPDGLGEPNKAIGRREVKFRVMPDAFREPTIMGPNELQWVDRPTRDIGVGGGRYYVSVESTESSNTYNVSAMVPVFQDVQGGITEARLRQAGTAYPGDLFSIYTNLPPDAMGPQATRLLTAIRATVSPPAGADPANPYDLARSIETYLRDPNNFVYDADVRDLRNAQCADVSSVECFAIIKRGYCEYYASTMAVLLRASHIPARVAYGFLPGERATDNLEVINARGSHWWVEVYFPGTGWVEFDPTGTVGQPLPIPSGSVGPPTPRPTGAAPTVRDEPDRTAQPRSGGISSGTGVGPFIAIAVILMIGVGALAWVAIRRTPTKPMHPDRAWGSLARLAARLGLGPRPSQTVYEYAGALGDEVPAARVELTTLARAKVEVAYGKRDLGADRLRRIAEAYHKLRLALIGLIVRRGLRRGKRR
jgi:transglutaminase-like putative cysteine protease